MGGVYTCKRLEVIEVVELVGKGTEDDPVRYVTRYFALTGDLLATRDNFRPTTQEK